jgi:ABC-type multidrug transport system ATPase subunit
VSGPPAPRAEVVADGAPAAAASEPALALTGIDKRWGPKQVLAGAELTLPRGGRVFLGGRNGAGKTTLIRIAAGLIAADSGQVSLAGLDPHDDRRAFQSRLGYLPAGNGGLYARLTTLQNLEFWASAALLGRAGRRAAVDRALDRFDLRPLERERVDRISMGQRQRVRLATTFLHDPEVVLLDEPHTSLDDEALELLRAHLAEHHDGGGSSLWCAPSRTLAALDADLAFVVADGLVRPA